MIFDVGLYGAFLVAAFILVVIPGPTVMTVVAYGLSHGPQAAWISTAGVLAGDALAVSLSLTGLGALLAVSPSLFTAVKWLGALYLLWLAVQTWLESNKVSDQSQASQVDSDINRSSDAWQIFRQNFVVTALNPKGIVFFLAFIPQFVSGTLAYWPQVALYGVSFVILGGLNALAYAYSAGRLSAFFTQPTPLKWMKRAAAVFLGSAGIYTALAKLGG